MKLSKIMPYLIGFMLFNSLENINLYSQNKQQLYDKHRLIVKFKDNEDVKKLKMYIKNQDKKYLPDSIKESSLIKLIEGHTVDNIRNIFTNFKNEPNYEETDFGKVYLIKFQDTINVEHMIKKFLEQKSKIDYAEPDYILNLENK